MVINSTQFIYFCISFKTESPINGSTKLKIKFSIVDDAVTKASHKLKDFCLFSISIRVIASIQINSKSKSVLSQQRKQQLKCTANFSLESSGHGKITNYHKAKIEDQKSLAFI